MFDDERVDLIFETVLMTIAVGSSIMAGFLIYELW